MVQGEEGALEAWTKYRVVEASTHCYGRPTTVWVHTLKAYESISHALFPLLLHGASVRKRRHRGVLLNFNDDIRLALLQPAPA